MTDDDLIGTWLLTEHHTENRQTGERAQMFGAGATGVLSIQPDGRMIAVITPGADRGGGDAPAMTTLAYSGRYRIEPGRFVTSVDIAWFPAWVGSEQIRWYTLDGHRLEITTAPAPMPQDGGDQAVMVGTMSWRREVPAVAAATPGD